MPFGYNEFPDIHLHWIANRVSFIIGVEGITQINISPEIESDYDKLEETGGYPIHKVIL